jgi:hypothetical protein
MPQTSRGFAAMDQVERRAVASKGGRAAHRKRTAHEWTQEEAREAGRKGGGILLRGGHNRRGDDVDELATALDRLATRLEAIKDERSTLSAGARVMIRRSLERAIAAIDRMGGSQNS